MESGSELTIQIVISSGRIREKHVIRPKQFSAIYGKITRTTVAIYFKNGTTIVRHTFMLYNTCS